MKIPVNIDEYGAVYVVPKYGGDMAGGIPVEVADDFDFTKLHLYHLVNGELVFDEQLAAEEQAREEQAEREQQKNTLRSLNEVLTVALLKMIDAESPEELIAVLAEIREKYGAELQAREDLKLTLYGPAEWVQPTGAHDAYALGAVVSHNGKVWVSTVDSNVWEPGGYGWEVQQ